MHRQGHLRPQDGHGGSGNHGSSGSSDGLAHSSSPGGINGQARLARPVIKPSTSGNRSSDGFAHSSSSGGTMGQARLDRPVVKPSTSGHRSSDGLAHSNNSGGTIRQARLERPVIKPSASPVNRVKTPEQSYTTHSRADSSLSPGRPNREHSSFTLNGQHINETWKPRPSAFTGPTQPPTPMSPAKTINRPILRVDTQHASDRQTPRNHHSHWASQQESKVRIMRLPKQWWTQDVYHAMSRFGTVVKIEMENSSRNNGNWANNAWVSFQPPTAKLPPQLRIGNTDVNLELVQPFNGSLPSPVRPAVRYLETNILSAKSIIFGVQSGETTLLKMQEVNDSNGVYLTLNLRQEKLEVRFPLKIDKEYRIFYFELPISQLSHIYMSRTSTTEPSITIPFARPPRFFVQKKPTRDDNSSFSKGRMWNIWSTMFRETDIVSGELKRELQHMPLMNNMGSAAIDIGYWATYRLTFAHETLSGPKFDEFCNALSDFGVTVRESEQFVVSEEATSALSDLLEEEYTIPQQHLKAKLGVSSTFKDLASDRVHLPFAVRYQLEACLSNNLIKMSSLTHNFLEKLRDLDSLEAVNILEKVVDKQRVYYDPMAIFNTPSKVLRQRSIPRHCVMQRSVNITPTMMHVASPVLEISNRITRQHSANADRFIRVKFSDEKGEGALRNMLGGRANAIFDRVHRAMKNGIVVAGRFYQFLAFGNSQFREHGAYFYAPTPTQSAEDIRRTLGHFEHIRTVAKYGARLGQCFSTTRAMQTTVAVVTTADIERNGYTFTDGVGKLSLFLAQMAAQDLGLHNAFTDPPSLFQFRLGGCKGVLALDRTITKNEVHIRPSQFKFEAPYTGLEIIRCSSLATPFFNRQIIIVLSNLGVPDDVFIRRQQAMMRSYELAMTDKTEALSCLLKHIDINQSTLMMASMVKDGFLDARDPFMMSLLGLWRASTIKELKKKARIAIDEGAFVLGCVDESGILQGHRDEPQSRLDATRDEKMKSLPEIFIQIDDTSRKGHYKIIEGVCILARNPSLHPGDIRVVRAVNVPALQHHKNVVVLPQTGDRDLANMCSGGDLDGDDFMVLWAEDLIPETINYPPMDFTPDRPNEEKDPIDISKVCKFFVTYMQNDSLGQIAHAHLAHADQHGVFSETCISLARLHSQAVDYPKSGIEAVMSPALRPRRWPHFMEKKHKLASQIYKSKNILGLLYDQVQLVGFNPSWTHEFDHRILDKFNLDESLLEAAVKIKASYDDDMRRLMAKHGIQTEFEAFSVFVLEHNHESRDYKFAEEFGRTVGILKAQYRETCIVASGATSIMDWDKLGPFVAAMYTVTAEEVKSALDDCSAHAREPTADSMPFLSFPWLFHTQLGKLATGGALKPDVETALAHRQRKLRGHNLEGTGTLGTLQTDEGILQFGDMLDLKFGGV